MFTNHQHALLHTWLAAHRHAWSGWPTSSLQTPAEQAHYLARLTAAGCPPHVAVFAESHEIIAALRAQHRDAYASRVRAVMGPPGRGV